MRRILALLILASMALIIATPVEAGTGESGSEMSPVVVHKVACNYFPDKNITRVIVTLQLPNPGYTIKAANAMVEGSTAIVNITVEHSNQPVIQVITMRGVTFNLSGKIDNVTVVLNGSVAYSGSCKPSAGETGMNESSQNVEGKESPESPGPTSGATNTSGGAVSTSGEVMRSSTSKAALLALGAIIVLSGLTLLLKQ